MLRKYEGNVRIWRFPVQGVDLRPVEGSAADKLAEIVDPTWEGPVPYTLLIARGGKIVRRWKDEVKPADLKNEISNALGKTYASKK